ncbi:MAG: tRNA 5-methoxyuridine(34)/uridine 5-oxyacetic acid(34) synthase CmoB [Zetaproteobacteria bacterium]|nr:tRNA 5-methoxyuridine(34)/uridine 5-oxyacetic acid(34) synthase CmoB [Zetaproteobacteria bacterium]
MNWADLARLGGKVDYGVLEAIRHQKTSELSRYVHLDELIQSLPDVRPSRISLKTDQIAIGSAQDLNASQLQQMRCVLKAFMPWKKGPFDFFGIPVDAEWNSALKWQRLLPHLPNLENKWIADIGCHNGYFMFKMAAHNPHLVVGIEPYLKHYYAFNLAQKYLQQENLVFEPCGVENMDAFLHCFDVVFCMGILYHHTDPVGLCRKIWQAMKPGATLVIDCQGIPGNDPIALVPQKRYARAKGVWFLPTESCLHHWLRRAQFSSIRTVFSHELGVDEQRRTAWAPVDSLAESLDPHDPKLTVEGYPRPHRFYVLAQRG